MDNYAYLQDQRVMRGLDLDVERKREREKNRVYFILVLFFY